MLAILAIGLFIVTIKTEPFFDLPHAKAFNSLITGNIASLLIVRFRANHSANANAAIASTGLNAATCATGAARVSPNRPVAADFS
jgi:hypothetical protein